MKTLYILRHAKSSWNDPDLADHDRPLNKRGKRDVPEMGARLKARGVLPDLVLCSDARRALDTGIPIAELLGVSSQAIRREASLYLANDGFILELLKGLKDRCQKVMIVGHNPGLTDLANRFLPQFLPNLPTAGIVELVFEIDSWTNIGARMLVHSSVDFPKNRS